MNQHYIQFSAATNLWWKKLLQPDKYKQVIIDSLKFLVENERAKVYGFVIMPNHIHIIWKINENHKLEDVQRDFLKFTAQVIKADLAENHPNVLKIFEVNLKDRKYQFWERNPLSVDLYSRKVVSQKLTGRRTATYTQIL
jgi:putative transposase